MKEISKYECYPKQAKCNLGEAWWYATKTGIELHYDHGGYHATILIPKRKIVEYMKRMDNSLADHTGKGGGPSIPTEYPKDLGIMVRKQACG